MPEDGYSEQMEEDHHRRLVQATVIAGHLAKDYSLLVQPTLVLAVLEMADKLGYINWESWQED